MPYADQISPEDKLLRTMIYGDAKTKKTWWAARCAELGFNVVLLDGDDGALIVDQLPLEARKRILVVDLVTRSDRTVMAPFMAQFLKTKKTLKQMPLLWDEQDHNATVGLLKAEHSHIQFDMDKFTANDVIVLDGWKALCESSLFQFAKENEIDLSDASKTEWTGYNFQANFLNWVLSRLHALPCHLIVIGHSTVYEKWDRRSQNPREHKMIEQRTQPLSSSGPHGKKLASHFTDMLYFDRLSTTAYKINTQGDRDRDGGSRVIAPGVYDWNDLPPKALFDKLGIKSSGAPCEGAKWYPPGVDPRAKSAQIVSIAAPATPALVKAEPPVIQNSGGPSLQARLLAQRAQKGGS